MFSSLGIWFVGKPAIGEEAFTVFFRGHKLPVWFVADVVDDAGFYMPYDEENWY